MNKILFDTSSLIAFVRYYLPFDKKGELQRFLSEGFNQKEFLLIKEVENECKKDRLEQQEYESQKQTFIQSADFKLIHYAIQNSQCTIITEESLAENDNKLFKKIPKICEVKGIKWLNLTKFIQEKLELSFNITYKNRLQI